MTKPLTFIFDCTTQEEILREMNDEEYAQHQNDKAVSEAKQAIEEPTND
jgi:hypothetical protein